MAVTDNYDFWNLDPAEEMSDFPSTWNWNIDKIDTAIHDAATAPVSLSRLPSLPASKTTSGTFADARIPGSVARLTDVNSLITVDTSVGMKVTAAGQVLLYDSGWRNATGLLINGWTADYVYLRRTLDQTFFRTRRLSGLNSTSSSFLNNVSGFSSGGSYVTIPFDGNPTSAYFNNSGDLSTSQSATSSSNYYSTGSWPMIGVGLPSTLPGTPA